MRRTPRGWASARARWCVLGNARGEVRLRARPSQTARPGVVIVEGNWPSGAYLDRVGINVLIGADPVPPNGGAAFHDTAIWMRAAYVIRGPRASARS